MNYYKNILIYIGLFFVVSSCSEDYLERYPLDQISTLDYWKSADDLEMYINKFYPIAFALSTTNSLPDVFSEELPTDNIVSVDANQRLSGTRVVPGSGGFELYGNIRDINYFLENYQTVEEDFEDYKNFVGEAYFFRAYFYFKLLKAYGGVPLIDKTLTPESEELYQPRNQRNEVADFIIGDLDQAIELLPEGEVEGKRRLSREIAQLIKSRVCLYEGTWEKYHTGDPFGVSNPDPQKYLNLAFQTAQDVMNSGIYRLHSSGNPELDYFFFGDVNHERNHEVMLWKEFDVSLLLGHSRQQQIGEGYGGGIGITKNFVESYLCIDGHPLYSTDGSPNSLYMGDDNLTMEATNRDPRMKQTIFTPGFPIEISGEDTIKFVRAAVDLGTQERSTTGYQICKTLNWDPVHHASVTSDNTGYTGVIIMRYAEVLLNFAEAKAELGSITQSDVNQSINLLRTRVGMPDLVISEIREDPNWHFPELSPIINEIRRERRIELILEGFRWDDIARWAAADELIIGKKYIGAKLNPTDYPDLSPEDFMLTDKGYLDPLQNQIPDGFGFDPGRDYLSPFSTDELTLNPNLTQNPGWE